MLSLQPTLTPDRVKYELTSTAHVDASNDVMAVGHGIVDGYGALRAAPGVANVGVSPSLGTGSLAASRGTVGVVLADADSTLLDASSGDLTSALTTFPEGTSWFGTSWFGTSWFGQPSSTEDYGTSWFGGAWYGAWDQ
jgi:hypothetical protein